MMSQNSVPEPLLALIRRGHRFVLTSHVHPDGDAIGSEIGLARILHKLGKGATIWNRDPAPRAYHALHGSDRIHVGPSVPAGYPDLYDAVIVLECPSPDRTGLDEELGELQRINIDHHLGNQHYGKINWVDSGAPAVGVMVYRIAKALNLDLDPMTANALYLALHTDTGGFRFSNTTPEAFDAAAALVRSGAEPHTVAQWLYESQPTSALMLLKEMLQSFELHAEGRVATVWLTQEMVERSGAQLGDSEGLIDHPRSVAGVESVALFRELKDGGYKVSLRSRGTVNVQAIAQTWGGGGHHNAAGFSVPFDGDSPHPAGATAQEVHQNTVNALRDAVSSPAADAPNEDSN